MSHLMGGVDAVLNTYCRQILVARDVDYRAFVKGQGRGADSPAYEEHDLKLLPKNNRRKKEAKEMPSCLITCLVVVEILVTAL